MRHRENLHATFLGTHLFPREAHSQHTAQPDSRAELAHAQHKSRASPGALRAQPWCVKVQSKLPKPFLNVKFQCTGLKIHAYAEMTIMWRNSSEHQLLFQSHRLHGLGWLRVILISQVQVLWELFLGTDVHAKVQVHLNKVSARRKHCLVSVLDNV